MFSERFNYRKNECPVKPPCDVPEVKNPGEVLHPARRVSHKQHGDLGRLDPRGVPHHVALGIWSGGKETVPGSIGITQAEEMTGFVGGDLRQTAWRCIAGNRDVAGVGWTRRS